MNRKLIRQGANALTVTLPKEWTERNKLDAGDDVSILMENNSLRISCNAPLAKSPLKIHLPTNPQAQRFILANLYRQGFDEMHITLSHVRQIAELQSLLEELLGVEIVEQQGLHITLKCVSLPNVDEYERLFLRTFPVLSTALQTLLDEVTSNDEDLTKMMVFQKNLLRLSNFCKRMLHTTHLGAQPFSYSHYVILSVHDYCISQARHLSTVLDKKNPFAKEYLEEIITFYKRIEEIAFKKQEKALLHTFDIKYLLFEKKAKYISSPKVNLVLMQELAILLRLMSMYLGPLSILVYDQK